MKSILIFTLLLTLGSILLTGCTTVPRDTSTQDTSVRRDTTTYSK